MQTGTLHPEELDVVELRNSRSSRPRSSAPDDLLIVEDRLIHGRHCAATLARRSADPGHPAECAFVLGARCDRLRVWSVTVRRCCGGICAGHAGG